eukprot:gnl/MRDRNA2_/MRDRNA2_65227_c0_seq1.p1 gnl/MRDRNA2_/MRDRNA2_65227_c0~~gnl/MRDRNA2_/MRDRNA2_65227_c0_seq1.p1  ORF type:complete len:277 (+),score=43.86 gnl/MRDRNA2_/MRDRNA2_65227_c0_seq1:42-872(+)
MWDSPAGLYLTVLSLQFHGSTALWNITEVDGPPIILAKEAALAVLIVKQAELEEAAEAGAEEAAEGANVSKVNPRSQPGWMPEVDEEDVYTRGFWEKYINQTINFQKSEDAIGYKKGELTWCYWLTQRHFNRGWGCFPGYEDWCCDDGFFCIRNADRAHECDEFGYDLCYYCCPAEGSGLNEGGLVKAPDNYDPNNPSYSEQQGYDDYHLMEEANTHRDAAPEIAGAMRAVFGKKGHLELPDVSEVLPIFIIVTALVYETRRSRASTVIIGPMLLS